MIVICEPEDSYKFYEEMMNHSKEIFKGLVGMTLIAGLLLVFNTITEFNAPGLGLLKSAVKGFVYVTFTMGVLIIAKSGIELLCNNSFKR